MINDLTGPFNILRNKSYKLKQLYKEKILEFLQNSGSTGMCYYCGIKITESGLFNCIKSLQCNIFGSFRDEITLIRNHFLNPKKSDKLCSECLIKIHMLRFPIIHSNLYYEEVMFLKYLNLGTKIESNSFVIEINKDKQLANIKYLNNEANNFIKKINEHIKAVEYRKMIKRMKESGIKYKIQMIEQQILRLSEYCKEAMELDDEYSIFKEKIVDLIYLEKELYEKIGNI